jgi:hypothetical protein
MTPRDFGRAFLDRMGEYEDRRRPTVFETFRWLVLLIALFWLCVAIGVWALV